MYNNSHIMYLCLIKHGNNNNKSAKKTIPHTCASQKD